MNLLDHINKLKESSNLDPARKQVLKTQLMQRVAAEQVYALRNVTAESTKTAAQSARASLLSRLLSPAPVLAVIASVVLLGGGVSFAAQRALPGEPLYGVKVNVNEKLAIAFAGTEEAKVQKQAEFASLRLAEASDLAATGKLEGATKVAVETRLQNQVAAVQKKIETLQHNGKAVAAVEIASQLESSLKGHKAILDRIIMKSDDKEIDRAVGVATAARVQLEEGISASATVASEVHADSANARITTAKETIASVRTLIEKNRDDLASETIVSAETSLNTADDAVMKAEMNMAADEYTVAFTSAGEAIRIAKNARLLLKSKTKDRQESDGVQTQKSSLRPSEMPGEQKKPDYRESSPVEFNNKESVEDRLDVLLKAGL